MIDKFVWSKPLAGSRLGRWLALGWVVILLLMPVHGFLSVSLSSVFGGYLAWRSWKELLMLLLLVAAGLFLWQSDRQFLNKLTQRRINQLIVVYVLLHILLAATVGPNLEAALYAFVYNLRFFAIFVIAQVLANYWRPTAANRRRLVWLILLPAGLVIGFGILQITLLPADFLANFGYGAQTIEPYGTIDDRSEWVRIFSLTRGANQLGQYLILPLILTLALWLKKPSRNLTLGWLAGGLVLVFSFSRSAWLGLAAAGLAYVLMSVDWRRWRGRLLIVATVAIALLASLVYFVPKSETLQLIIFHDDQAATDVTNSNQVRVDHTRESLNLIADQPLGYGPGAAGPASFHNDEQTRINDNYYLQLALEVGIFGLILFLGICWLVAKNLWRQRQEVIPRVLLSVFIGLTFVNLFLPAWAQDEIGLIWWGLAGLWYRD